MVRGRLEGDLWPEAARNTGGTYCPDVSLLGYVVMPGAKPASNDRAVALLTWECREMKIMSRGFRGADLGSIPGHWWNSSFLKHWTITD